MRKTFLLALLLSALRLLNAEDFTASEAAAHVRETVTVCGKVTGTHYAAASRGKPTFINFDKPYPNQDFTVMVWDDDAMLPPDLVAPRISICGGPLLLECSPE